MFIVVYNFASSRAIWLDTVPDTSCSSFICSIKRFISVNDVPDLYIRDNEKFFTGRKLKDYLSMLSTSWCYILDVFPWRGGFWEKKFKLLREAYEKVCPNQNLCMTNYSLLLVRSNQWSIQGCYVMCIMIVLRKSLRLQIYCLVDVF